MGERSAWNRRLRRWFHDDRPGRTQNGKRGRSAGEAGKTTNEQRAVEQGQPGASSPQTQRVRPARPGQEQQTTESGQRKQLGEQGTATPGLSNREANRSRPIREGYNPLLTAAARCVRPGRSRTCSHRRVPRTGSKRQAPDQNRRLRSSQPERTAAPVQSEPTTGTAPASRQQVNPFKGRQDTQTSQTGRWSTPKPEQREPANSAIGKRDGNFVHQRRGGKPVDGRE